MSSNTSTHSIMPKKKKQDAAEKKRLEKREFFLLVRGIQSGRVPKGFAKGKALRASQTIDPDDVKSMLKTKLKPKKECIQRVIGALKEMAQISPMEPTWISEHQEDNAVASNFVKDGDFDIFVNQFRGIQLTSKEKLAAQNFDKDLDEETKPNVDNFNITVDTSDDFGNNTHAVIKKLQEKGQFVWTAFIKTSSANTDASAETEPGGDSPLKEVGEPQPQAPPASPAQKTPPVSDPTSTEEPSVEKGKVTIKKSIPFSNDTEGARILNLFLKQIEVS